MWFSEHQFVQRVLHKWPSPGGPESSSCTEESSDHFTPKPAAKAPVHSFYRSLWYHVSGRDSDIRHLRLIIPYLLIRMTEVLLLTSILNQNRRCFSWLFTTFSVGSSGCSKPAWVFSENQFQQSETELGCHKKQPESVMFHLKTTLNIYEQLFIITDCWATSVCFM